MNKKHIFIFAVLGILVFALGAQLATAQPVEIRLGDKTIAFLPLIISSKAADAPSGVLYVFSSTATTDGDAGGRAAMGDICTKDDLNSHFCSIYEVENAFGTTGVFFSNPFDVAWVDYPTRLGTTIITTDTLHTTQSDWWSQGENQSTSCASWANDSGSYFGAHISAQATNVGTTLCTQNINVACCKWTP